MYGMRKAAVTYLTRSASAEVGKQRIRVNEIAPALLIGGRTLPGVRRQPDRRGRRSGSRGLRAIFRRRACATGSGGYGRGGDGRPGTARPFR